MKLKSPGLVLLMNESEGGVVETNCRFQSAWPASNHPARSPMRGSGRGGDAVSEAGFVAVVLYRACARASLNPANIIATAATLNTIRDFTESSVSSRRA